MIMWTIVFYYYYFPIQDFATTLVGLGEIDQKHLGLEVLINSDLRNGGNKLFLLSQECW